MLINLFFNKSILNRTFRNKFIILVVILVLTLIITSQIKLFQKNQDLQWKYVNDNISQSLLQKVISIDSSKRIKLNDIRFIEIPSDREKLYLFDLNSPRYCGIAGCLYSLYDSKGHLLLRIVADSRLPPDSKFKFIDIEKPDSNSNLPCLIISQTDLNEPDLKIIHSKYCYFHHQFKLINQTFSAS